MEAAVLGSGESLESESEAESCEITRPEPSWSLWL